MYTKGPWIYKELPNPFGDYDIQAPDGDDTPWEVATVVGNCGYNKSEPVGNARLIAAAPELLEALVYARRLMKPEDFDVEYIDRVIKKAKGE